VVRMVHLAITPDTAPERLTTCVAVIKAIQR